MTTMDLNSDLGESFGAWRMGDDEAILRVVTSANVACGFHAGDPAGILATVRAAVAQGVTIGAHVAYPDLVGFGRRNMDISSAVLVADVIYQIGALQGLAAAAGTTALRQTARCAVQHHCAGRPPGQRRDCRHPRHQPRLGAGRSGGLAPGAVGA